MDTTCSTAAATQIQARCKAKEEVDKNSEKKAASLEIKARWKTTGSHTGNKNLSLRQNKNNASNAVLHDTKLRKEVPVSATSSGISVTWEGNEGGASRLKTNLIKI